LGLLEFKTGDYHFLVCVGVGRCVAVALTHCGGSRQTNDWVEFVGDNNLEVRLMRYFLATGAFDLSLLDFLIDFLAVLADGV